MPTAVAEGVISPINTIGILRAEQSVVGSAFNLFRVSGLPGETKQNLVELNPRHRTARFNKAVRTPEISFIKAFEVFPYTTPGTAGNRQVMRNNVVPC